MHTKVVVVQVPLWRGVIGLPESGTILGSSGQVGNDACLGVGPHSNDQGPPVALQHLAATQQQRVLACALHHIICLTGQLTLIYSATGASKVSTLTKRIAYLRTMHKRIAECNKWALM